MGYTFLIIAGLLILLNSLLNYLFDKNKYVGCKFWILLVITILSISSVYINYVLQEDGKTELEYEKASLNSKLDSLKANLAGLKKQNHRLLQENTSLAVDLKNIINQNDSIKLQIRPFLDIALSKYPDQSNDIALKNLKSYLISSMSKITPYIKDFGYKIKEYKGDKDYKLLTEFKFQALNDDNSNVNIVINFLSFEFHAEFDIKGTLVIQQGSSLSEDKKNGGVIFHTGILKNANYLYIRVLSNDSLDNISVNIF